MHLLCVMIAQSHRLQADRRQHSKSRCCRSYIETSRNLTYEMTAREVEPIPSSLRTRFYSHHAHSQCGSMMLDIKAGSGLPVAMAMNDSG